MQQITRLYIICSLLLTVMGASIADASSYFTFGTNDTLRIRPNQQRFFDNDMCHAHFEKRMDSWSLTFSFPLGLSFDGFDAGPGMAISYKNFFNHDTICQAPLIGPSPYTSVSSHITTIGYWDYNNDGIMDPYGTVKWEPGDYQMFEASFNVGPQFISGNLVINGTLSSGPDSRGNYQDPPVTFQRTVVVIVGYDPGDVNGNGVVSIADVTMLISYLLGEVTLDQYQLVAADFNGDGSVSIADAIAISDYLNLSN